MSGAGEEVGARRRVLRRAAILMAPLALAGAVAAFTDPRPPAPLPEGERVASLDIGDLPHTVAPPEPEPKPEPEPEPEPKPEPKPEPAPEPEPKRIVVDGQAALPVAVEVPAVDISAPVGPLGLTNAGALEVPKDFSRAGWWAQGPEPGEAGAAVITAHVDSTAGPAAFYTLADASHGDEVVVHRKDGSSATFVIDRMGQYPKDDFPTQQVYGETPKPTLRLITCGGTFDDSTGHYRDNIVAYATRKPT